MRSTLCAAALVLSTAGAAAEALPHAALREGWKALDEGRSELATERLQTAAAEDSLLGDHALRLLAGLASKAGRGDEALGYWRQLLDRHPSSTWRPEAALAVATKAFADGEHRRAETLAAEAIRAGARGDTAADAKWLRSRAARERGALAVARRRAEALRDAHASSRAAASAREAAWLEREEVALASAGASREEIARLLSEGEATQAKRLLDEARGRFPELQTSPAGLWLEARILRRSGDTDGESRLLERLTKRHAKSREATLALSRMAYRAWNRDSDVRARAHFEAFLERYPRRTGAGAAIYSLGRIHQEAERYEEAAQRYAELVRKFPRNEYSDEARWRIGWTYYRAGRFAEAAKAFAASARAGSEVSASLYWQARSLEKSGGEGSALYRRIGETAVDSYYALRSEARLGLPSGSFLAAKTSPQPALAEPLGPPPSDDPRLLRAAALLALDRPKTARRELSAYERLHPRDARAHRAWLLPAWAAAQSHHRAIRAAARAGGCALNAPEVRYCYPFGYPEVLREKAESEKLDPLLVAALIRQESAFQPDAISSAGARGLMQLMPATAKRVAESRGRSTPSDLYDPPANLSLGTAYLQSLLIRYDGSIVAALAGYNAGERAVAKWQRRYPDLEEDEFVESISYSETRDYVKKVLRNSRIYRALYAESDAKWGGSDGRRRVAPTA